MTSKTTIVTATISIVNIMMTAIVLLLAAICNSAYYCAVLVPVLGLEFKAS